MSFGRSRNCGAHSFAFDLDDETSIAEVADAMSDAPPDLVIVASGVLTLDDGTGPERSYRSSTRMLCSGFSCSTLSVRQLLQTHAAAVRSEGTLRVRGTIGPRRIDFDNRLGGWHSYRASKAALNMLLRNFAIELGRTHKQAVIAGLHPGTVDTQLSEPFQSNLPDGQLIAPSEAAANLLEVISRLEPSDSGKIFDYAGEVIPA